MVLITDIWNAICRENSAAKAGDLIKDSPCTLTLTFLSNPCNLQGDVSSKKRFEARYGSVLYTRLFEVISHTGDLFYGALISVVADRRQLAMRILNFCSN